MNYSDGVKLIVYVPIKSADEIRSVLHAAGAGNSPNYSSVSYSSKVINRYTPTQGADPDIGNVGETQEVEEERIEVLCPKNILQEVITKMKQAHPYEEVAYDVYERLEI